jgi:PAS domain-containing protein
LSDMIATEQLNDIFAEKVARIFGADDDPMVLVEHRARQLLPDLRPIVWEGDAQTFQFSFVGGAAEEVLGHPASRWTSEPAFWADVVVHPDDRNDAIAFCALATGKGADHDFEYRARCADGRIVLLHDIVKVIKGPLGVAERLRGIISSARPPERYGRTWPIRRATSMGSIGLRMNTSNSRCSSAV